MWSGVCREDSRGQLALLDAMVFFAVCLLICNVLVVKMDDHGVGGSEADLSSEDVNDMMRVFLSSSFGPSISLVSPPLRLSGHELFVDVLALLAEIAVSDPGLTGLEPVTSHCEQVLKKLCTPAWTPELRAVLTEDGDMTELLSIGGVEPRCDSLVAASQTLTIHGGLSVMLLLVLSPALAPHLGQV